MATLDSLPSTIVGMYKEYFSNDKMSVLTSRTDPFLGKIEIKPAGGKYYDLPWLNASNGNAGGSFTKVGANAANKINVQEPKMLYGRLFASWVVDPMEFLQSSSMDMAFEKIGIANMRASLELMKRYHAATLYGSGQHEIGKLLADAVAGDTVIYLPLSAVIKLDVQSSIIIQSSVTEIPDMKPASLINSGTAYIVSKINRSTGQVTLTVGLAANCAAGTWVGIDGGVDSSGNSKVPTGLGSWAPSFYNRGAAGGADLTGWNNYIATSFYGIDRSTYVENLAGSFVLQNAGENIVDAVIRGISAQRTAGGYAADSVVLMNSNTYLKMTQQIGASVAYYKYAQGAGKNDAPRAVAGFDAVQAAFSTSMIGDIVDTPYCPEDVVYIIEKTSLFFAAMSKHERMFQGTPADNEPGQPTMEGTPETTNNYAMLVDDWISTSPYDTDDGQAIRFSLNMYGNFASSYPSHNCVVKLIA